VRLTSGSASINAPWSGALSGMAAIFASRAMKLVQLATGVLQKPGVE